METKNLYFYDDYVVKNGELRKYYGDRARDGDYTYPNIAPVITEEAATRDATSITFLEGVKVLGRHLCGHSCVRSVSLPNSLEEIGESCFYYCSDMTEIFLPKNLKKIGEHAFSNTGLAELVIPPSVVEIGSGILSGSKAKKLVVSPNAKIPNFLIDQSRIEELRITAHQFDEVIKESQRRERKECKEDPDTYCPFGGCQTLKKVWLDDREFDDLSLYEYATQNGCSKRTFNRLFWNTPFHTDKSMRRKRA